jgi:hypothetical protein
MLGVMPFNAFGKSLVVAGLVLVALGLLIQSGGRLPFRLGRLPGDIVWRGKSATVYIPLATCVALSLLFSLVMWFVRRR